MAESKTRTGFQPATSAAERRAFFDLLRQLNEVQQKLTELEERIEVLEP